MHPQHYLHEGPVGGNLSPIPDPPLYEMGACSTISGNTHIVVDLSQVSDYESGSFVMLVFMGANSGTANLEEAAVPSGQTTSLESAGWISLVSRVDAQYPAFAVWLKEWESTDATVTFSHQEFGQDGQLCYRLYKVPGLSRRMPVDYLIQQYMGGAWRAGRRIYLGPEQRIHGNYALQQFVWTHAGTDRGQNIEQSAIASNHVLALYEDFPNTTGAVNRSAQFMTMATENVVAQNGIKSQTNSAADRAAMAGWGRVGVEFTTVSDSVNVNLYITNQGNQAGPYYLTKTVTLVQGADYILRLKASTVVSSSFDDNVFALIRAPNGDLYGGSMGLGSSGEGYFGDASGMPVVSTGEFFTLIGDGYSGLPDNTAIELYMRFRAQESGNHQIWFGALEEDTTLTHSDATRNTQAFLYAAAFGEVSRGMPFFRDSSQDDPYFDNMAQTLLMEWPSLSATQGQAGNYYWQWISEELESLNDVKLLMGQLVIPRLNFNSTVTGIDGGLQPARANSQAQPWRPILADRVVLPWYRTTEGGPRLRGRYYWEVTLGAMQSSQYIGWGLAQAEAEFLSQGLSPGIPRFAIMRNGEYMAGTNNVRTASGETFTSGDVIGFALDVWAKTLELYKNGVSFLTFDLTAGVASTSQQTWIWRAFAWPGIDGIGGSGYTHPQTWNFNFKGPFAYSKPSGFVAYDFLNEVS